MADIRTLKKSYLRDAALGRPVVADQVAWLETQRVACQAEVAAGDWEVTSQSMEMRSTSAARRITAGDRLQAIIRAMEDLEELNGIAQRPNRPGIILPQFEGILR